MKNLDIAALLVFLIFAMYVPDIVRSVRRAREVREGARRITQEHSARKALERLARGER
jgi:hypothetical protein